MKKKTAADNCAPRHARPAHKAPGCYETTWRKRDAIIKGLRLRKTTDGLDEARQRLAAYLQEHAKKNTAERLFILTKLYQLTAPADIETIHRLLSEEGQQVSIATVYNTMQLFIDARLVKKIELVEGGMSFYERAIDLPPHFFIICNKCGNITPVYKPDLLEELQKDCPKNFKSEDFSLNVYGLCHKCQLAIRKAKLRKIEKEAKAQSKKQQKHL